MSILGQPSGEPQHSAKDQANAAMVAEANRVIAVAYRALCSAREALTYGERRDTIDGAIDEIENWKQRRGVR